MDNNLSYGNQTFGQNGIGGQTFGPYGQTTNNQNFGTVNQRGTMIGNQTPSLIGRMIRSESDISPNEIPMNGNIAFFVQSDLQRVYAKAIGNDGLVHTNVYTLIAPSQTQAAPVQNDAISTILERLDGLEKMIKKQRPHKPKYNKQTGEGGN